MNTFLFLGGSELLIILIIALLLFGGAQIPKLMRGLGEGLREFKKATNEVKKEVEDSVNSEEKKD